MGSRPLHVDVFRTASHVSGFLAIGILDISLIVGIFWIFIEYPIIQTIVLGLFAFSALIAVIFALAFRWGGKDEDEPY